MMEIQYKGLGNKFVVYSLDNLCDHLDKAHIGMYIEGYGRVKDMVDVRRLKGLSSSMKSLVSSSRALKKANNVTHSINTQEAISILLRRYSPEFKAVFNSNLSFLPSNRFSRSKVLLKCLKLWSRYPVEHVETSVKIFLNKNYSNEGKSVEYLNSMIERSSMLTLEDNPIAFIKANFSPLTTNGKTGGGYFFGFSLKELDSIDMSSMELQYHSGVEYDYGDLYLVEKVLAYYLLNKDVNNSVEFYKMWKGIIDEFRA